MKSWLLLPGALLNFLSFGLLIMGVGGYGTHYYLWCIGTGLMGLTLYFVGVICPEGRAHKHGGKKF